MYEEIVFYTREENGIKSEVKMQSMKMSICISFEYGFDKTYRWTKGCEHWGLCKGGKKHSGFLQFKSDAPPSHSQDLQVRIKLYHFKV